jgi:hypothetical protein
MLLKKELTEYNRYQAFAVHMVISLVIFFILLVCITQYWYPGILFDTGNGWKAIGIIIGIDLILGPLLTLIVFNHNKSSLKFDLAVIALIQTAALIYGTWTIHNSRPVAIAFVYQSFSTIYANAPFANEIEDIINSSNRELIYISDTEEQSYQLNPKLFKNYAEHTEFVINKIKSLTNDEVTKTYRVPLANLSDNKDNILIDATTGKILKFIPENKAGK